MKSNILKSAIIVGGLLICVVDGAEAQSNLPSCGIINVIYDNCFGTYTFPYGEEYVGEVKDGNSHDGGIFKALTVMCLLVSMRMASETVRVFKLIRT